MVAGLSVEKILISACLLGHKVRYDGNVMDSGHALIQIWQDEGRLVAICPEVAGGLAVPRPAAEIQGGDGRAVLSKQATVETETGKDVSNPFLSGAQQALAKCRSLGIRLAILKENSPSCGVHSIHDGSFSNRYSNGSGVTTTLLKQAGLMVFSEDEIQNVAEHLDRAESCAS
jgi:uncharacterized protein YbbK (DUF523 family)